MGQIREALLRGFSMCKVFEWVEVVVKPEPEPRGGARTGGGTGKGPIENGTEEEEDRLVECSSTLNLRLT